MLSTLFVSDTYRNVVKSSRIQKTRSDSFVFIKKVTKNLKYDIHSLIVRL